MSNFDKPQTFVGIYITPDKIDAVLCNTNTTPWTFEAFSVELDDGLINSDGEITDEKVLSNHIKDFWKLTSFDSKKVVISLWGKKVIIRLVHLPDLPEEHLYQTILSEAERYALFREDTELYIDYSIQDKNPESGDLRIAYAVAPKELVQSYKRVFQKAGLKVLGIDVAQMSSQRALSFYHPPIANDGWASAILVPGKILISYWTEGLLKTWREVALMFYDEEDYQDFSLIAESFESEVVRTIDAEPEIKRDSALYIGANSNFSARELAQFIQNKESINMTIIGDMHSRLSLPDNIRNMPIVSIGVSLWNISTDIIPSINLLSHIKPTGGEIALNIGRTVFDNQKPYLKSYAVLGLLIGLLSYSSYFFVSQQKSSLLNEIKAIQTKTHSLNSKIATLQQEISQPKVTSNYQKLQYFVAQERQKKNTFPEKLIEEIHAIIPTDAWLDSVIMNGSGQLTLEGGSIDKNSGVYFMEKLLANFPNINSINKMESTRVKDKYSFKIGVKY